MGIAADRFRQRYGPWALVAGASEGLGAEFAVQLAGLGLNVVLVARREEKLAALAQELTSRYAIQARALPHDLGQPQAAAMLIELTQELRIGLLVYNAALSVIGPFLERSLEAHQQELSVNCATPLALAYAFGRRFQEQRRGGIILLSSLSAGQGSALISHYAATKAYNQVLAEGLWEEWRGAGVDALACCLGATATPNYFASLPARPGTVAQPRSPKTLAPHQAVAETLAALGKTPSVIPGRGNRLAAFVMRRILPRAAAIRLMGQVLRSIYGTSP
jgi:short-subunit dehydrogenase